MSAAFDEDRTWNQTFKLQLHILLRTEIFQHFSVCFIRHNAEDQNVEDSATTLLIISNTETNSLGNNQHNKSSNRGMMCDSDGTNQHLLAS